MLTLDIVSKTSEPIIWNNEPVCTTQQLVAFYGVTQKWIKDNFQNNKSRFQSGKHCIVLNGKNFTNFLQTENFGSQISKKARSVTLYTRRGAARHAKMLNSEKAWDVFEALEDHYFNERKQTDLPVEYMSSKATWTISADEARKMVANMFKDRPDLEKRFPQTAQMANQQPYRDRLDILCSYYQTMMESQVHGVSKEITNERKNTLRLIQKVKTFD